MSAFKNFQDFRAKSSDALQGKAKTVLVIVMLVVVLGIGILAAFLGANIGSETEETDKTFCDDQCAPKCHQSKIEKGWKAFSITLIALGIPLLVVFFLFFGCTTAIKNF